MPRSHPALGRGALALVALLAACGGTDAGPPAATIRMIPTGLGFDPERLTVASGARVRFTNEDTRARWPASNIHPTHAIYSAFDPRGEVAPGKSWDFVFARPGIWRYHDHLYPELIGTVTVE